MDPVTIGILLKKIQDAGDTSDIRAAIQEIEGDIEDIQTDVGGLQTDVGNIQASAVSARVNGTGLIFETLEGE